MKKILLIIIVLLFSLLPLSAQKTRGVLYLKNGSKIYGSLMEVNDSLYKLKTNDGSFFIFPQTEVEKFENEAANFEGRKASGLSFALEAGCMVGAQTAEYNAPFSFNYIFYGTSKTNNLFGAGSGVEFIGQTYIPLFAEYKRLFYNKRNTPFIFIRGGEIFHINGENESTDYYPQAGDKTYKGGFSMTMGTGISWFRNNTETYLSFAYRNAHTSYTQLNYNNQTATYKTTLNRLEIKLGFRF